jgi:hypothetical protein
VGPICRFRPSAGGAPVGRRSQIVAKHEAVEPVAVVEALWSVNGLRLRRFPCGEIAI